MPVYAAATVRAQLRETARRVCVAFAPHLPPVCRYHAHAFGVDRARVAFAVASLAGGGISLDAPGAMFLRAGPVGAPRRRRSRRGDALAVVVCVILVT